MSFLLLSVLVSAGLVAVSAFVVGIVRTVKLYRRFRNEKRDQEQVQKYLKTLVQEQQEATERLQDTLKLLQRRQIKTPQVQKTDPASTIQDRLKKAGELTVKQSKIDTRLGHESIMQHNELELEKLVVLKTILADGFDPVITIRYNSGDREMALSAYVESINKVLI